MQGLDIRAQFSYAASTAREHLVVGGAKCISSVSVIE
jgi:hypothetical protein